jgi:hypothetical protein
MERVTTDRGEIIHLAGRLRLSPGLDAGRGPALSSAPGDGVARCGWAPFFRAMEGRRLALAFDPDGASARLVPAAAGAKPRGPGLAALEHARRFWSAWRRQR